MTVHTGILVSYSQLLHVYDAFLLLLVVDCGTLSDITNGQVNHNTETTFGQTATYSCNTGYNLVGNITRTCQPNGVWSKKSPTCQRML